MEYVTIGKGDNNDSGKIVKVYCNLSEDFNAIKNKSNSFVLCFVLEGEGIVKQGNRQESFVAPCFICADERDNVTLVKSKKVKARSLYFNPEFLNINMKLELIHSEQYDELVDVHSFLQLTPFTNDELVVPVLSSYTGIIDKLFMDIYHQLALQPDWYWSCRSRSYFMEIIQKLEQLYDFLSQGRLHSINGNNFISDCDIVRQAIVYISTNYAEPIKLPELAKKCNTNRTTLSDKFKSETGMTVAKYILKHRIELAADKLRFTFLNIKEIAKQCGFKSSAHFCRTFKEYMNEYPGVFRETELFRRIRDLS